MKPTPSSLFATLVAATGMLLSSCVLSPKQPTTVAPEADPVLKRLSTILSEANAFSYSGSREVDSHLNPKGTIKTRAAISGTVQRPDRFYGRVSDAVSTRTISYDGDSLTVTDTNGNVYATLDGQPTLDRTLDLLIRDWAVKPPMAPFLRSNFYESVTTVGGSWTSHGVVRVGEKVCDHLRLSIPAVGTADLMVARSDGLPRELTITYSNSEGESRIQVTDIRWNLHVKPAADLFRAKIPAGATKVEMIPAP